MKYDYSKVVFRGLDYNIRIVCPTHGEFKQLAEVHIGGGNCPKCAGQYSPTTEEWKERAALIHHGKYRYDKVIFTRGHNKVIITCPIHGDFMQEAKRHLEGYGCSKCSGCKVDQEDFIKNARKVHGEDYIYDNVNYKNNHTKVCIICPEHGEFWQKPNVHLNGHGCPICKKSHLERSVETMLRDNNIPYEGNYRNKEIFGQQSLDFYLPHINIAIECQGEQHYVKNYYKKFGEETCTKRLEYVKALDVRKNKLCAENGIELIYYQEKKLNKYFSFNNLCFNTLDEIKEYILAKYKK